MVMLFEQCVNGLDKLGDGRFLGESPGVTDIDLAIIRVHIKFDEAGSGYDHSLTVFPLPRKRVAIMMTFEDRDRTGRDYPYNHLLIMERDSYAQIAGNPFVLVRRRLFRNDLRVPSKLDVVEFEPREKDLCFSWPRFIDMATAKAWGAIVSSAVTRTRISILTRGRRDELAEATLLCLPLPQRLTFSFTTCLLAPGEKTAERLDIIRNQLGEDPADYEVFWRIAPLAKSDDHLDRDLWRSITGEVLVDLRGSSQVPTTVPIHAYAELVAKEIEEHGTPEHLVTAANSTLAGRQPKEIAAIFSVIREVPDPSEAASLQLFVEKCRSVCETRKEDLPTIAPFLIPKCCDWMLETDDRSCFGKILEQLVILIACAAPSDDPKIIASIGAVADHVALNDSPLLADLAQKVTAGSRLSNQLRAVIGKQSLPVRLKHLLECDLSAPQHKEEVRFWFSHFASEAVRFPDFPALLNHCLIQSLSFLECSPDLFIEIVNVYEEAHAAAKALPLRKRVVCSMIQSDAVAEFCAKAAAACLKTGVSARIGSKAIVELVADILKEEKVRRRLDLRENLCRILVRQHIGDLEPRTLVRILQDCMSNKALTGSTLNLILDDLAESKAADSSRLLEVYRRLCHLSLDQDERQSAETVIRHALRVFLRRRDFKAFVQFLDSPPVWQGLMKRVPGWVADEISSDSRAAVDFAAHLYTSEGENFDWLLAGFLRACARQGRDRSVVLRALAETVCNRRVKRYPALELIEQLRPLANEALSKYPKAEGADAVRAVFAHRLAQAERRDREEAGYPTWWFLPRRVARILLVVVLLGSGCLTVYLSISQRAWLAKTVKKVIGSTKVKISTAQTESPTPSVPAVPRVEVFWFTDEPLATGYTVVRNPTEFALSTYSLTLSDSNAAVRVTMLVSVQDTKGIDQFSTTILGVKEGKHNLPDSLRYALANQLPNGQLRYVRFEVRDAQGKEKLPGSFSERKFVFVPLLIPDKRPVTASIDSPPIFKMHYATYVGRAEGWPLPPPRISYKLELEAGNNRAPYLYNDPTTFGKNDARWAQFWTSNRAALKDTEATTLTFAVLCNGEAIDPPIQEKVPLPLRKQSPERQKPAPGPNQNDQVVPDTADKEAVNRGKR